MTKINKTRLANLFIDLVKIPSPSGYEADMVEFTEKYMRQLGWKTWIDNFGKSNKSNTENLYSYLEVDKSFQTIVFCAHVDTVQQLGQKINPTFDGKMFKTDTSTILSADNKAGVAALLYAASIVDPEKLKYNVLFFFPTREEAGVMGSSFFDFDKSIVKFVLNIDNSDKFGIFVKKALGFVNFKIIVKGKKVHAAKSYEQGVDAIAASGLLLTSLPIGKNVKKGWTLNVGKINGGKATNVVCDKVVLYGELRAFKKETIELLEKKIKETCKNVAKKTRTEVTLNLDDNNNAPPFSGENSQDTIKIVREVCKQMKVKPVFETSYTSSDANYFEHLGYSCISVSRGGRDVHSNNESLMLSDLASCTQFITKVMKR